MRETHPADRPPLRPFDHASATLRMQAAEDTWNTRDPALVAGAYTADMLWRNSSLFLHGRADVIPFLTAEQRRIVAPRPDDGRDDDLPVE